MDSSAPRTTLYVIVSCVVNRIIIRNIYCISISQAQRALGVQLGNTFGNALPRN